MVLAAKKKIAILGATGQIAKTLIDELACQYDLLLFARNVTAAKTFIFESHPDWINPPEVIPIEQITHCSFDIVINAAGPGDPQKIRRAGLELFRTTEYLDNLILDILQNNSKIQYINLSTGAIYGNDPGANIDVNTKLCFSVNNQNQLSNYSLAKFLAEAKHRACPELAIADIRIFGYFSRYIDLKSGFFLAELANSIVQGTEFVTNSEDFVRDYVAGIDLAGLIDLLISKGTPNGAYDLYSREPLTKAEVLAFAESTFGLKLKIQDEIPIRKVMTKPSLISSYDRAEQIGYQPQSSSIETFRREMKKILELK